MKELIAKLEGLKDLSPDEIVAEITDPLAKPLNMYRMSLELFRKIGDRRVHWYMWRNQAWVHDTVQEGGEPLDATDPDHWVGYGNTRWCITSHEYFLQHGGPTEPPPSPETL